MRNSIMVLAVLFCFNVHAQDATVGDKIRAAMAADIRGESDVDRDGNRMPLETLTFFGLTDDMRVLELLPGGGWYTKILAPVLRDNGQLFVAIGTNNVRDNLLNQPGFDRVNIVDSDLVSTSDGPFGTANVQPFNFDVRDLDLVLTFRNMHNYTESARVNINMAVFEALKAGGRYGVIDHSRRHMEPMTAENRRRADVVQIIKEAQAAGFIFEDYSDLHYRPDDELRYEVGRATVTGNTDRFTLLFRKP